MLWPGRGITAGSKQLKPAASQPCGVMRKCIKHPSGRSAQDHQEGYGWIEVKEVEPWVVFHLADEVRGSSGHQPLLSPRAAGLVPGELFALSWKPTFAQLPRNERHSLLPSAAITPA